MEETSASSKPILIDSKCLKNYKMLTCILSASDFRPWKLSPDAKLCPNVSQDHASLTAIEIKYFVPETLRIRFLDNQPELLSQNTCWLYRRASADHVTARVNSRTKIKKVNLFKCFQSSVPLETDPLSLCRVPGVVCMGVERIVHPHHLSIASSHKEKHHTVCLECLSRN